MPNYKLQTASVQLDLFIETDPISDSEYVDSYADFLRRNKVPIIYDFEHFSKLVGYRTEFIGAIANAPLNFYRKFEIAKKSGGVREISEPLPSLKEIQNFILKVILKNVVVSKTARGFKKNNSPLGNASMHKKQKVIVCMDIKDFFGSIRSFVIYQKLYELGYTKQIARLISALCCLENKLPQGAPTSPILSNIVMYKFDEKIFAFCKEKKIRYTRYADDITISGDDPISTGVLNYIHRELRKMKLELNDSKFRVMRDGHRKIVTGVVVNEKTNSPIEIRKKARQEMYYIRKYGLNGHIRQIEYNKPNYIDNLIGRLSNLYFITKNEKWKNDINYLVEIKRRSY